MAENSKIEWTLKLLGAPRFVSLSVAFAAYRLDIKPISAFVWLCVAIAI